MGKQLFKAQINGTDHVATTETETDEGGNKHDYILVKANNKEQRFSPTYTVEELKEALGHGDHSPQSWEAKLKEANRG